MTLNISEKTTMDCMKNGNCYLAIRHKKILGSSRTIKELCTSLKPLYKIGEYIVQKCDGTEYAYTAKIPGYPWKYYMKKAVLRIKNRFAGDKLKSCFKCRKCDFFTK